MIDKVDVIEDSEIAWDSFKQFSRAHPEQFSPPGADPERIKKFGKRVQNLLDKHEEIMKAVFTAGFVGGVYDVSARMTHMAEFLNRQHDPRAPRA
jgi:hypothetical protein